MALSARAAVKIKKSPPVKKAISSSLPTPPATDDEMQEPAQDEPVTQADPELEEAEPVESDAPAATPKTPVTRKKKRKSNFVMPRKSQPSKRKRKSEAGETLIAKKADPNSFRVEVMTKLPSLKKVRDYKGFPSFRATMDDKTVTEFKKDQAVFVLPDPGSMEDPDKTPEQSDYWIALIKDIRANSILDKETNEWTADPSEVFVIVEWFYKPEDVAGSGMATQKTNDKIAEDYEFFGMKELIRSEHEAVISVFSCCEPCPIYYFQDNANTETAAVQLLDEKYRLDPAQEVEESADTEEFPNHLHASQANHFYRLTLPSGTGKATPRKKGKKPASVTGEFHPFTLHCVCQKPYAPPSDIMRYCQDCSKWFHENCLTTWSGPVPELDTPNGKPPTELIELATMPIVRGAIWGVGGNINIIAKARSIVASGDFETWENDLALAGAEEWKEWLYMMEKTRIATEKGIDVTKDEEGIKGANAVPTKELEALMATGYVCPDCDKRI